MSFKQGKTFRSSDMTYRQQVDVFGKPIADQLQKADETQERHAIIDGVDVENKTVTLKTRPPVSFTEYDTLVLENQLLRKELQNHIDKCKNFHFTI